MNSSSWSNFHISAKNIFFGHLSELPLSSTHNLMFWSRNKGKKINPCKHSNGFRNDSRKRLRTKVTPDFHLTYSKNGGNLGSELK